MKRKIKEVESKVADSNVQLHINIFKDGKGRYSVSNIYAEASIAEETGRMVKGYFKTVVIELGDNDG